MIFLEAPRQFVAADAGGDGESAEIIVAAAFQRGDEIGQREEIGLPFAFPLLPQEVKPRQLVLASFVGEQRHIVADRSRRPKAVHAAGGEQFLGDDLVEQPPGVVEQLASFAADVRIVENSRILALQFPGEEKRRPIDERNQFLQRQVFDHAAAGEGRRVDLHRGPIGLETMLERIFVRHELDLLPLVGTIRPVVFAPPDCGARDRRAARDSAVFRPRRRPARHRARGSSAAYTAARFSRRCVWRWSWRRRSTAAA